MSGAIVTNTYDGLLRRSSLSGTGVSPVQFSYDAASRLNAVTNGTYTASYTYLPNSPLVSNIVFNSGTVTRMTTTKNWDNLNRLQRVDNVIPSLSRNLSVSYDYNSANQRTKRTDEDNSYWDYTYDTFGQVTSGNKHWSNNTEVAGQQFGYTFDSIGNRTANNANGRESSYTANNLNQYTQRTVPGYIWELGSAASNATVTINNQGVSRYGEYFSKEFNLANSSSAVYTQLVTVGVRKNSGGDANQPDTVTTETGHEFVPKTPEQFTYDADGNLTSDGRWSYTWDGENRLIEMQTLTNLSSIVPWRKLVFKYDDQGRRIEKMVVGWSGPPLNMPLLRSWKLFIYDGWNLIAEREVFPTPATQRTFTWGLDLSGSMQGAGGVGGLLMFTQDGAQPTNHLVAFDGNGNVAALLNADSGAQSATYEYGPFGEVIRANGPVAEANPFRFSTKFQDDESDLLYYGYRYYNPSTGRWPSRDPIGERGLRNLPALRTSPLARLTPVQTGAPGDYRLGQNSPCNEIDSYGLLTINSCEIVVFYGHSKISYYKDLVQNACSGFTHVGCRTCTLFKEASVKPFEGYPCTTVDIFFNTLPYETPEDYKGVWWEDHMKDALDAAQNYAANNLCKCSCCGDKTITIRVEKVQGVFGEIPTWAGGRTGQFDCKTGKLRP